MPALVHHARGHREGSAFGQLVLPNEAPGSRERTRRSRKAWVVLLSESLVKRARSDSFSMAKGFLLPHLPV